MHSEGTVLDAMMADTTIMRLALALAIGLLVGLERGWRERGEPAGSRTAGIRTYGGVGLLGGVAGALSAALSSPATLIAVLVVFAAVFGWFKFNEARHDGNFSVTGVVAALLVFALGALAVVGDYRVAAAGGAILAGLLASREALHAGLAKLSWIELRSAIVLAVMTAVVLPILPNRTIDPWGGLNPWEIWFFTVLTAAISFMGYVAVRLLGPARGLLLGSLAGAVVSSTAVTVALARTAAGGSNAIPLAGASCLAAMVSILRVTGIVIVVEPRVLPHMILPAIAAAGTFAACGLLMLFRRGGEAGPAATGRNPFDLGALLLFAVLFAVVAMASAAVVGHYGGSSVVATSGLSGTFDVDVAVLSALRLLGEGISGATVGTAVLAALAANGLGRFTMAATAGPVAFWLPYLLATLAAAALASVAYALPAPPGLGW
jgi:uncharacterized membrane protein (DUF4010 family)